MQTLQTASELSQPRTNKVIDDLCAIRDRLAQRNARLEDYTERLFGSSPVPPSPTAAIKDTPALYFFKHVSLLIDDINGEINHYETALDRLSEL